jgi:hypothetical protein
MAGDHGWNGASMNPCDKILATTPTLRDNAVVATPSGVVDR